MSQLYFPAKRSFQHQCMRLDTAFSEYQEPVWPQIAFAFPLVGEWCRQTSAVMKASDADKCKNIVEHYLCVPMNAGKYIPYLAVDAADPEAECVNSQMLHYGERIWEGELVIFYQHGTHSIPTALHKHRSKAQQANPSAQQLSCCIHNSSISIALV